jgi:hypothetical protein
VRRSGFTLLEVMVAIVLPSDVALTVYAAARVSGGVRQAGGVHLPGEGVLHQHDDAGQFILMDLMKRNTRRVS